MPGFLPGLAEVWDTRIRAAQIQWPAWRLRTRRLRRIRHPRHQKNNRFAAALGALANFGSPVYPTNSSVPPSKVWYGAPVHPLQSRGRALAENLRRRDRTGPSIEVKPLRAANRTTYHVVGRPEWVLRRNRIACSMGSARRPARTNWNSEIVRMARTDDREWY